jgi:hypothetical protein
MMGLNPSEMPGRTSSYAPAGANCLPLPTAGRAGAAPSGRTAARISSHTDGAAGLMISDVFTSTNNNNNDSGGCAVGHRHEVTSLQGAPPTASQEHHARLMGLVAATRGQNHNPRHQYEYHQQHNHQPMRPTYSSFPVGGASAGRMLPDGHHTVAWGQAAAAASTSSTVVNPFSVPAAASSLEEGTQMVGARDNTNQNVEVPVQQYTDAQLLALLQQHGGMFEQQQQQEEEEEEQQDKSIQLFRGR